MESTCDFLIFDFPSCARLHSIGILGEFLFSSKFFNRSQSNNNNNNNNNNEQQQQQFYHDEEYISSINNPTELFNESKILPLLPLKMSSQIIFTLRTLE